jgi:iron(III) transport system substrate-binding protein
MKKTYLALIALCGLVALPAFAGITVYTDRPLERFQPIADKFKADTGVEVTLVGLAYGDMIKRLDAEGDSTPADLLMVKDLVFLGEMSNAGRFQPMQSTLVQSAIAPAMRHPANLWTAVTFRARTLVYASDRVQPSELATYEDLAKPEWKSRLCLRTSKGGYNEALVASLVANNGKADAKRTVQGWMSNLAADVFPNDTSLMEAMTNGTCDVGIVNSYYLGQLLKSRPNFPVKILFANQDGKGVHTNGAGIGIAKQSKNKEMAARFIEALLTDEAQLSISSGHMDYPAKVGLLPNTLIREWGTFKMDNLNWSDIAREVPVAKEIFSEVNYK